MATITNTVRWADNTATLKANLLEGIGTIDAMKASVDRTAASLGGQGLFLQANKVTAAIDQLGGITKLTAAEQDRANALLDKAIEKYQAMGMTVPTAMQAMADSMKPPADSLGQLGDAIKHGIEDPMGTAKTAMTGFVTELGPAGIVLTAVGAVAAAIGTSLMELGEHAEETGASFARLSMVSGASVSGLSDLRFALDATGGATIDLDSTMFMFQKRMENNASTVDKGLQEIGLSLADITDLSADQQILKISQGFQQAGESVNKSAAAFDIFGKQGREMLPSLMQPLTDLADKSRELGNTWTEVDAKAAHEFEIAVKTMATESASAWTQLGRDIAPVTNDIALGWDRMKLAIANVALTLADVLSAGGWFMALNDWEAGIIEKTPEVSSSLKGLADGSGLAAKGVHDFTAGIQNYSGHAATFDDAIELQKEVTQDLDSETRKHIDTVNKHQQAIDGAKAALEGDTKSITTNIEALDQLIARGITDEEVKTRAIDLITKLEEKGITLTDRIYKWDEAQRQLLDSTNLSSTAMERYDVVVDTVNTTGESFSLVAKAMATDAYGFGEALPTARLSDLNDVLTGVDHLTGNLASSTLPDVTGKFIDLGDSLAEATTRAQELLKPVTSLGDTLEGSVMTALDKIPNMLIKAFEGGGGLTGAIKAIGVTISESILTPLMNALDKVQKTAVGTGSAIATALGGATGGGTGAAVAGIASGLGGAALAASAWGASMTAAGVAGTVALGAATLGIGAAAIGVVALIKHFTGVSDEVKAARATVSDFEQQIWGSLTASQAVEAEGEPWKATVIGVRDAYLATGRSAEEAQADVKAMWDSSEQGAAASKAAIDKINQAFSEQKQDAADLDTAIQKYGFSIAELGPTMQKQQLTAQAVQLENDFRVLAASGIDINTVLEHMGGSINDFLANAQKTGSEVPTEMKPILEKMIEMGTLTDANGNKITDLGTSGITFSETMTQGFDAIVTKLTELINKIAGTTGALNAIPSHINTTITTTHEDVYLPPDNTNADGASTGGFVTNRGIQHFAAGGSVLAFTPQGTDTIPAMLTPGESVLTRGATSTLGLSAISTLNRGGRLEAGSGGREVIDIRPHLDRIEKRLAAQEQAAARRDAAAPREFARAVRDAMQGGGRR